MNALAADALSASPARPRNAGIGRRMLRKVGLALGIAMLAVGAIVGPAAAVGSSGWVGPVSAPGVVCVADYSFGNQMYVPVPTIYSSNRHAGAGNDLQTVRYWTRAVDLAGRPLTNWIFTGQGTANDNVSASLPYAYKFGTIYSNLRYPITSGVKAEIKIAWYEGSTLVGVQDSEYQAYLAYSFGWMPGTFASC
jgi:hypothetical protein